MLVLSHAKWNEIKFSMVIRVNTCPNHCSSGQHCKKDTGHKWSDFISSGCIGSSRLALFAAREKENNNGREGKHIGDFIKMNCPVNLHGARGTEHKARGTSLRLSTSNSYCIKRIKTYANSFVELSVRKGWHLIIFIDVEILLLWRLCEANFEWRTPVHPVIFSIYCVCLCLSCASTLLVCNYFSLLLVTFFRWQFQWNGNHRFKTLPCERWFWFDHWVWCSCLENHKNNACHAHISYLRCNHVGRVRFNYYISLMQNAIIFIVQVDEIKYSSFFMFHHKWLGFIIFRFLRAVYSAPYLIWTTNVRLMEFSLSLFLSFFPLILFVHWLLWLSFYFLSFFVLIVKETWVRWIRRYILPLNRIIDIWPGTHTHTCKHTQHTAYMPRDNI